MRQFWTRNSWPQRIRNRLKRKRRDQSYQKTWVNIFKNGNSYIIIFANSVFLKYFNDSKKTIFLDFQNGMGMIEGPGNNTGEEAVLMSYHNGSSSVSLQRQKRVLFFINQCKLPCEHCKDLVLKTNILRFAEKIVFVFTCTEEFFLRLLLSFVGGGFINCWPSQEAPCYRLRDSWLSR